MTTPESPQQRWIHAGTDDARRYARAVVAADLDTVVHSLNNASSDVEPNTFAEDIAPTFTDPHNSREALAALTGIIIREASIITCVVLAALRDLDPDLANALITTIVRDAHAGQAVAFLHASDLDQPPEP